MGVLLTISCGFLGFFSLSLLTVSITYLHFWVSELCQILWWWCWCGSFSTMDRDLWPSSVRGTGMHLSRNFLIDLSYSITMGITELLELVIETLLLSMYFVLHKTWVTWLFYMFFFASFLFLSFFRMDVRKERNDKTILD